MDGPSTLIRRRGAALLVTVSTLAVLAALAVSFARLTKLERLASADQASTTRARLAAEAGIEFGLARIRAATRSGDHGPTFAPYARDPASGGPAVVHGTAVTAVLATPETGQGWQSFAVQVRDPQGLVNLNAGTESLARVLESLGQAIDERDPPLGAGDGMRIVGWRDALPGKRFRRLEDLLEIPGGVVQARDLERIVPFVTLDSWVDEKVICPPSPDSRPEAGEEYERRWLPGPLALEPRAPVNVNTAPEEVLVAVIAGVEGVREVWSRADCLDARWVQVRSGRVDLSTARLLARRLVERRKVEPFRSWQAFRAVLDGAVLHTEFANFPWVEAWISRNGSGIRFLANARTPRLELGFPGVADVPSGAFDLSTGCERRLRIEGVRSPVGRTVLLGIPTEVYSGWATISLEFPAGTYRFEGDGSAGGYDAPFASDRFAPELLVQCALQRVEFEPKIPGEEPILRPDQAAALAANFDPNTRLAKFHPDREHRVAMDKTDLLANTTEVCFWPMGPFEIDSVGYVHSPSGDLVARQGIRAIVRTQQVWRDTTQADFLAGTRSAAGSVDRPVAGGLSLTTYPVPESLRGAARFEGDGSVLLSTCETPAPDGLLFRASYASGLDADRAAGDPRALPADSDGPEPAGQGTLLPDGVFCDRHDAPSYAVAGNLADRRGTVSFWVKPDWSPEPLGHTHYLFRTTLGGSMSPQWFGLATGNPPVLQFVCDAAAARTGSWALACTQVRRSRGRPFGCKSGEWQLVTFAYDLDDEEPGQAVQFVAGGEPSGWSFGDGGVHQDRTEFPSEALSANADRFVLGGGVGASSTIDELTIRTGSDAAAVADRTYRRGRYYSGGDATFVSRGCPLALARSARVARIAWTARVPANIPGGRLRMFVRSGDEASAILGDADGSSVDLPVQGAVHYEARFEETAAEDVVPLLESMALEDVTVFFLVRTEIVRWESDVAPDRLVVAGREPPAEPLDRPGLSMPVPPAPAHRSIEDFALATEDDPAALLGTSAGGAGERAGSDGGLSFAAAARIGASRRSEGAGRGSDPAPARRPAGSVAIVVEVADRATGAPVPGARANVFVEGVTLLSGVRTPRTGRLLLEVASGAHVRVEVGKRNWKDGATEFVAALPGAAGVFEQVVKLELEREE